MRKEAKVTAAGAGMIGASGWLTWATVTFGELDVRPSQVGGTDVTGGWALASLAVVVLGALLATALVPRAMRAAATVCVIAGIAALGIVAAAALATGGIVAAATDVAAARIADVTGLPADRLAALLGERVGSGATVQLGIGVTVGAIGAIGVVTTGLWALARDRRTTHVPDGRIEPGTEHLQPV